MRIGKNALVLIFMFTLGITGNGLTARVHGGSNSEKEKLSGTLATKVLFVGNSLTYTNDLPGTLTGIAASGNVVIECSSVTRGGFALIDHLDGGSNAVDVIRQGGWQYVILQQGPSSLPESRVILIDGAVRFDEEIRAVGAKTALYMVWPDKSRFAYFEDVRQNYKAAADTVGGLFLPGGEAWLKAWAINPSLGFYGPDDFHPSPLGTFLVALVMYERIAGADARELPPTAVVAGETLNVSEETVRLLQSAAHETNARYVLTEAKDSPISDGVPATHELRQNFPNPFNPSTSISYRLPARSSVRLKIFDVLGSELVTLVDGIEEAGTKTVRFDARDLAGGVYYYRLQTDTFVETKKLVLLK